MSARKWVPALCLAGLVVSGCASKPKSRGCYLGFTAEEGEAVAAFRAREVDRAEGLLMLARGTGRLSDRKLGWWREVLSTLPYLDITDDAWPQVVDCMWGLESARSTETGTESEGRRQATIDYHNRCDVLAHRAADASIASETAAPDGG